MQCAVQIHLSRCVYAVWSTVRENSNLTSIHSPISFSFHLFQFVWQCSVFEHVSPKMFLRIWNPFMGATQFFGPGLSLCTSDVVETGLKTISLLCATGLRLSCDLCFTHTQEICRSLMAGVPSCSEPICILTLFVGIIIIAAKRTMWWLLAAKQLNSTCVFKLEDLRLTNLLRIIQNQIYNT